MHNAYRLTTAGQDPYVTIPFRTAVEALDLASCQLQSGIVSAIVGCCTCSKLAAKSLLEVVSASEHAAAAAVSSLRQPAGRPAGSPDHPISSRRPRAGLSGIGESASAIGTSSVHPRSVTEPPSVRNMQCESGNLKGSLNRKGLPLRRLARVWPKWGATARPAQDRSAASADHPLHEP
jgi:hypothetical protein